MAGGAAPGLSRRGLIQSASATAIALVLTRAGIALGDGPRPNVLVLMSEDCGAEHLAPYGGPASTPVLERLADEGVRWEHCMSAAPVCAPSRTALISGLSPESCGPAHQMRAEGRLPAELRDAGWPALLRAAGYHCTNNEKTDYNVAIDMDATWDASSPTAHWRARPAGAPFFAVFNPQQTHESSVFVPLPPGPGEVRIPPYLPDTPTTRRDAGTYLNRVNAMDAEMGRRLAELDAAGLADDTIVIYTSDHAGVLPRSKRFCFDSGLRVPLIVRFGRRWRHLAPGPPGTVVRSPVMAGVDIPVTVLGCAGIDPRPLMEGTAFAGPRRAARRYAFSMRGRMDERFDMQRTVRDERYRYVRNYLPHLPYGQHVQFMFLQAGYREWAAKHRAGELNETQAAFWREKPAEELYDVAADRDEVVNLAGDPRHAGTLRRLRAALDEHMVAVNDNGFIPEGSALQGWDASRAPGAYPLRRVMDVAGLAIRRDRRNVPVLVRHLRDRHPVVRYWAALGCRMLGVEPPGARSALRRAVAADPDPHVRLAAAEALGDVPYLAGRLTGDDSVWIRLYAANALEHLGDRARPALPALVRASLDLGLGEAPEPYVSSAARHTLLRLGLTPPHPPS